MFRTPTRLIWVSLLLGGLAIALVLRYIAALEAGVSPAVAIRTYVFWALVVAPVAYVADAVGRAVLDYRVVQLALARVQQSRRQR